MTIHSLTGYQLNGFNTFKFYGPYGIQDMGPTVLSFNTDKYFDIEGILLNFDLPITNFNMKYSTLVQL